MAGRLWRTGEVSITVSGTRYTAVFEVWAHRGTFAVVCLPSPRSLACKDPKADAERGALKLLRELIVTGRAEKTSAIQKEKAVKLG